MSYPFFFIWIGHEAPLEQLFVTETNVNMWVSPNPTQISAHCHVFRRIFLHWINAFFSLCKGLGSKLKKKRKKYMHIHPIKQSRINPYVCSRHCHTELVCKYFPAIYIERPSQIWGLNKYQKKKKKNLYKNRHNKLKLIHHNFHISLCWAVGQPHHIICLTHWVTLANRILPHVCCCHDDGILSGMSCSQISSSSTAADTQQLSAFDHKQEFTPQSVCQKGSRLWWRSTSARTTSLFLFPLSGHCYYH